VPSIPPWHKVAPLSLAPEAAAAAVAVAALQGGMFIFDGELCVWSHFDQATGAHADFADILGVAQQLTGKDCGCSA